MEKDLITIGITSFNSFKTIKKAIDSAIDQRWINKEILVVDDSSNDGSWEIIKNYEKYSNIRLFRNPKNAGVAYSRNFIISNSKGKYIVFFDDDDQSSIYRLNLQYLNLKVYKNIHEINKPIFCYCKSLKKFQNKKELILNPPGKDISNKNVNGKRVAEFILKGSFKEYYSGYYATCSLMGLRKDFIECNAFDENFRRSEDTEFVIRSSLKGAHFIGVNKTLVFQTMSYKLNKGFFTELKYTLKMLKKHRSLFKSKKEYAFEVIWNFLKYKIFKKEFFISIYLFIKLCFLDLPYLIKRIYSIGFTFKNNLFILRNYKRKKNL